MENGDEIKIVSELGKMIGRVRLTNTVREGIVKSSFIALGSDDFKSIRVLPVKIERG